MKRQRRIDFPSIALLAIGGALGFAIALIGFVLLDPQSASIASTISTTVAVIAAIAVGTVPWLIAREDRRTRAVVLASRIAHELRKALTAAETIRDGAGHVAETADGARIQTSATRCLPSSPETLDQYFEKVSALSLNEAQVVCRALMAAIDQYNGVFALSRLDLEEAMQACLMQVASENGGTLPEDLEKQASAKLGKMMMRFARQAAARAMDAQTRIPLALAVLRRHGAVMPTELGELFESPIPEVAEAVRRGNWPMP